MDLDKALKLGNRFSIIDLDDELIFIPSDEGKEQALYKANSLTSITICRSLLSGKTPREIIDQLVQLFDVERLIAERDVIDFTEALLEKVFFMSEIEIYGKKQYVQALAEKASKKGKILSAMIELLDQCNFHCRYCYVRGSTNSTLSLESVKRY